VRVILTVRQRKLPLLPIEAESITPASFLEGTDHSVWKGNKELPLTDLCEIEISGEAETAADVEIVLRGETGRIKRVGEYMAAGRITIEGDIGMHCGNFMSGGIIEIGGNADGWLGREMTGGTLICHGNAADYCASGYRGEKRGVRGGTVEVFGDVGAFCAEALDGGRVIVHGNAGDLAGVEMRSGEMVIHGDCWRPGANMTGGSVTVLGTAYDMIPTFREVGQTVHTGTGRVLTSFIGDIANRGKGNLFVADFKYMD